MYLAGIYQNSSLVEAPHMQWLDMPHNRGFFLDYTMDSFFALNLTVNLSSVNVVTGEASSISPTEATLHGLLVCDGGGPCSVYFEYGTTTSYGNITENQTKTTGENFSETVTGLLPETLYHYRAVASNSQTKNNGTDCSFCTLPYMNLTFEKPRKAVYFLNQKLFSFPVPVIIGRIEVIVNATSANSSIVRIEFYIGTTLEAADTTPPFSWMWTQPMFPSKKFLTVKAYDIAGHSTSKSLIVYKIF